MLSLGIHAAILASLVSVTAIPAGLGQPPESIRVDVVAVAPPAEIPEETVHKAEAEPLPPVVTSVSPSKPEPRFQPPKAERRRAIAEPAPPIVAASEPVDGRGGRPDVPSVPTDTAPEAPVVGAATPAVTDDGLRLYGEAIRARILDHKPTRIRSQGTVGLTFSVSTDGRLLDAAVSMSSGSGVLDQAALNALRAAAPFPPPPEAAPPQLTFSLPFEFR
jgi:protein TonB